MVATYEESQLIWRYLKRDRAARMEKGDIKRLLANFKIPISSGQGSTEKVERGALPA